MKITEYNTKLNAERYPILEETKSYNFNSNESWDNPKKIYKFFTDSIPLQDATEEFIYCLAFDTKLKIKGVFEISHGTIDSSLCSPREIFRKILMLGARAFSIVHNHPSGDSTPSNNDIYMAKRLKECGDLLDVKMIDNIVIGYKSYYSFVENNNL